MIKTQVFINYKIFKSFAVGIGSEQNIILSSF